VERRWSKVLEIRLAGTDVSDGTGRPDCRFSIILIILCFRSKKNKRKFQTYGQRKTVTKVRSATSYGNCEKVYGQCPPKSLSHRSLILVHDEISFQAAGREVPTALRQMTCMTAGLLAAWLSGSDVGLWPADFPCPQLFPVSAPGEPLGFATQFSEFRRPS